MRFTLNNTEYEVTSTDEMEGLNNMRESLIKSNKEPRVYYANKVLNSGKVSDKQGGMFYRFNSGNFIKVL